MNVLLFETIISRKGAFRGGCGNRISGGNFYIVFPNNYGSILLSFRDTTTDGPLQSIAYLALKAGRQLTHIRLAQIVSRNINRNGIKIVITYE